MEKPVIEQMLKAYAENHEPLLRRKLDAAKLSTLIGQFR